MVKFNSMRVVTSTPAPILRRRGMSSNTSDEHKAAQRIMKRLKKTHPDWFTPLVYN